jgi:hypothetical protein
LDRHFDGYLEMGLKHKKTSKKGREEEKAPIKEEPKSKVKTKGKLSKEPSIILPNKQ